jgi:hypothetical protein
MRGLTADGTNEGYLLPNTFDAEALGTLCKINSTGFQASGSSLCAANGIEYIYIAIRRGPMKVPTLGTTVFSPVTRTGTSTAVSVTGVGFPPDMMWSQYRDSAGNDNVLYDKLRGPVKTLFKNITDAEQTPASYGINSFDQDGVSLAANQGYTNNSGSAFIYDFFRRAPSFFDEVCWSGAGANLVINHNLQAVPELIINKYRNGTSYGWATTAAGLVNPNTNYIRLNTNGAEANSGSSPGFIYDRTSTTFTVSSDLAQSGFNWVSYLFATCPGVSKVGSYTGNGSTQTINCGFGAGGARFVLIKRIDDVGDWYMYDTARGMTVLTDPYLLVNSTAAEVATLGSVTTVSTGFALNATILAAINTNAASYIFLAIA